MSSFYSLPGAQPRTPLPLQFYTFFLWGFYICFRAAVSFLRSIHQLISILTENLPRPTALLLSMYTAAAVVAVPHNRQHSAYCQRKSHNIPFRNTTTPLFSLLRSGWLSTVKFSHSACCVPLSLTSCSLSLIHHGFRSCISPNCSFSGHLPSRDAPSSAGKFYVFFHRLANIDKTVINDYSPRMFPRFINHHRRIRAGRW